MLPDITALSPEEKLQQYFDFNNVAEAPTGYVEYIPNEGVKPQSNSLPKIDSTALSSSNYKPLIYTTPKPKGVDLGPKETKETVGEALVGKDNPIAKTMPTPVYKVAPNIAARKAFSYLMSKHKLAPHVAAGIVGNLYQESGLDPTRKQENGGPGRGIAQWTEGARWKGLQKWAKDRKRDPFDLMSQLDFILEEPGQEKAIAKTLSAKNADEATMTFGRLFEAPKESAANWAGRKGIANHLLSLGI